MDKGTEDDNMDHCNMARVKDVTKKLEPGEKIIGSWKVSKVNNQNKVQDRVLLLTNRHVINIQSGSSNFFEKIIGKKIKRKIQLDKMHRVVLSKISDMFVLKVQEEHDYLFISHQKTEIVLRINE